MDLECGKDFVVTGIKQAEQGKGLVLRGYDSSGKGGNLKTSIPAIRTNLLEETLPGSDRATDTIQVKPWEIVTLKF
jgi:alpha-mannosidase